jgi:hypothetical protein
MTYCGMIFVVYHGPEPDYLSLRIHSKGVMGARFNACESIHIAYGLRKSRRLFHQIGLLHSATIRAGTSAVPVMFHYAGLRQSIDKPRQYFSKRSHRCRSLCSLFDVKVES